MKRMMIISTLFLAMTMACADMYAQPRERRVHETRMEHRDYRHRKDHGRHDRREAHHKVSYVKCAPPRVAHGCYVPGWEGRVRRHHDGRWGYYVNGCWKYYTCYYDPYAFFCEPLPPRPRPHHVTVTHHASAGEVAAGVVAGTVIGCVIGALAR